MVRKVRGVLGAIFRRGRGPRLARAAVVVVSLASIAGTVFYKPLFEGNFGVVDPGRVYRSAQPVDELIPMMDEYRLGSVLNLRGGSEKDDWYAAEVKATNAHGVDFYDLPLNATRRPTRRELLTLLNVIGQCRYPLLIHCRRGSDRTGMASALYLMTQKGEPPEQALRTFTLAHGHVALGGTEHLHEPFLEYQTWLEQRKLPHTPARFRAWVENDYKADDDAVDVPVLKPGPRVRRGAKQEHAQVDHR